MSGDVFEQKEAKTAKNQMQSPVLPWLASVELPNSRLILDHSAQLETWNLKPETVL
jgi:hypothetical protein